MNKVEKRVNNTHHHSARKAMVSPISFQIQVTEMYIDNLPPICSF